MAAANGVRRIFSGIQPSGAAHLGNYLGALRQWTRLQDSCDSVLFSIVDLHAMTSLQAPLLLRENVLAMVTCLLACGVDPRRSIVFQQSQVCVCVCEREREESVCIVWQVSGHSELAWLLGCRTPIGWLNRMTQWKVIHSIFLSFALTHSLIYTTHQSDFKLSPLHLLTSSTHSFTYSHTHSLTHPPTHSLTAQAKAMSDNTDVVGLGLFAYPVLQAADILLYK